MTRPGAARATASAGFALPTVLIVAAMVSLVLLVAIQALGSLADETRRAKREADVEAAALSLEARAAFLAGAAPVGPMGLMQGGAANAPVLIRLDGAAYAVPPDLLVSLQDEAGLVNLDNLPVAAKARLVTMLGVTPPLQPTLFDRLGDYMDPTASRRPQGADAADYARENLPPPPTGPFRSASQVLGVMGLREAMTPSAWRALKNSLTADPSSTAVNVNTATPMALALLYGLNDHQIAMATAARAKAPFSEIEDLGRAAGVELHGDAERSYAAPNGRIALKVEDRRDGLVYRSRLLLSPDDAARPFWVVESNLSSLTEAEKKASPPGNAPSFPDPAA